MAKSWALVVSPFVMFSLFCLNPIQTMTSSPFVGDPVWIHVSKLWGVSWLLCKTMLLYYSETVWLH
jgi:hypothetical protein